MFGCSLTGSVGFCMRCGEWVGISGATGDVLADSSTLRSTVWDSSGRQSLCKRKLIGKTVGLICICSHSLKWVLIHMAFQRHRGWRGKITEVRVVVADVSVCFCLRAVPYVARGTCLIWVKVVYRDEKANDD